MFENKYVTPLSELGEFGLIDVFQKSVVIKNKNSIKGIGDDAAVIEKDKKTYTLVSTDMLVQGVHFDLTYVPLKHLGYKAAIVNFSDIYAMNGKPEQIVVSIAVSSKFSVEAIEELYEGMLLACDKHNVDLVGGDTCSSLSGLVINITVIGSVNKNKVTYRESAKEKNLLVVSGDLGGAYIGLQILEREKEIFKTNPNFKPELEGVDYVLERQLKPEARKDIVELLDKLDVIPTSMIDISDGLASEAIHLAVKSNLGVRIYEEKIPIDPLTYNKVLEFELDPTVVALNGGEDYELLFSINASDYDKIKGNPNFTVIGHFSEPGSGYKLVTNSGSETELRAQGWDAFLKRQE
jgi:thiamine-monophosphate kinase